MILTASSDEGRDNGRPDALPNDRPTYPASVRGTNRKATGMYCHTRKKVAERKLMSRSTCLQDTYMLTANVIQPKAIRWRAWNREVSFPTMGSTTSTTKAPAEST